MSGSVHRLSSRALAANFLYPNSFLPGGAWLSAIVVDYRRAMKAAQRYESLIRRPASVLTSEGIAPSGVSRLIFDEYFRD
jgi:hypothetical protein